MPRDWSLICRASAKPNMMLAPKAPRGIHLPKIMAARAMKPRPPVMPQVKMLRWAMVESVRTAVRHDERMRVFYEKVVDDIETEIR